MGTSNSDRKATERSAPGSEQKLLKKAQALVRRSYSPYSSFRVASVIEDESGKLFSGVNIENASYRLTMCAEQTAIGNMITGGSGKIKRILVHTPDADTITPCGACLQMIAEHSHDPLILLAGRSGKIRKVRSKELLLQAFTAGRG